MRIATGRIALAAFAAAALLAVACGGGEGKRTIVFSDLNWESPQIQNRLARG